MATDNIARAMAARALSGAGGKTDSDDTLTVVAAVSSGNVNTYRATMRRWFLDRLPDGWTAADLTALCDKWYTITRTGWAGGTEFYGWSISQVSTGTRIGDAKGLTCTPSTDMVKNKDDFEGLPLFAIKDCNWIVDADTLEPVITAIDGITDNFVRDNPDVYVGVLQMAPWHFWVDDDNTAHNFIHGADKTGTTYLSTFHWSSGSCDGVLGNDGSPIDCKNGKYPAKLQGIEYMVGGYEVLADTILRLYKSSDGAYATRPAIVSKSAQQAASATSDYKEPVNLLFTQPSDSAGWKYTSHMYFADGAFFPRRYAASSSTGTRDGLYTEKDAVGTREYLAFGNLSNGSGNAGLSCLHAGSGLGNGGWYSLARLSPTGNRGEFSA